MRLAMFSLLWAGLLSMAVQAGTVEDIKARGTLSCGVEAKRAGVSILRDGKAQGLAVDLCASLAAAVLGRKDAVGFVAVTPKDAYAALQAEEVDVLLLSLPWRFADEIEQGVMLVQPLLRHRDGSVVGPMLRHGDDGWFTIVRWTVLVLQAGTANESVAGASLGLSATWMGDAINAAGNFDEMIARHETALEQAEFSLLPKTTGPQF